MRGGGGKEGVGGGVGEIWAAKGYPLESAAKVAADLRLQLLQPILMDSPQERAHMGGMRRKRQNVSGGFDLTTNAFLVFGP